MGSIKAADQTEIDQSEIPLNTITEFGSDTNQNILNDLYGTDISDRLIKKFGIKLFKNLESLGGMSSQGNISPLLR